MDDAATSRTSGAVGGAGAGGGGGGGNTKCGTPPSANSSPAATGPMPPTSHGAVPRYPPYPPQPMGPYGHGPPHHHGHGPPPPPSMAPLHGPPQPQHHQGPPPPPPPPQGTHSHHPGAYPPYGGQPPPPPSQQPPPPSPSQQQSGPGGVPPPPSPSPLNQSHHGSSVPPQYGMPMMMPPPSQYPNSKTQMQPQGSGVGSVTGPNVPVGQQPGPPGQHPMMLPDRYYGGRFPGPMQGQAHGPPPPPHGQHPHAHPHHLQPHQQQQPPPPHHQQPHPNSYYMRPGPPGSMHPGPGPKNYYGGPNSNTQGVYMQPGPGGGPPPPSGHTGPPSIMDEVSQTSTTSSQAADDSCSSDMAAGRMTPNTGTNTNSTSNNSGHGKSNSKQQHSHHSHPSTPNTSNLGSPGAASLSSYHDDFDSVSSPSWPRTPASPALNNAAAYSAAHAAAAAAAAAASGASSNDSHSHGSKRSDGIQKLYEMSDEPERRPFLDKYIQFQEERGSPFTQVPTISKIPLDLYRLYLAVKERGGFVEVTRAKLWKDCAAICNIANSSSAAYTLRKQYMKHLLPFECKFDRGGIDPGPVLSALDSANTNSRKKTSAAATKAAAAAAAAAAQAANSNSSTPNNTPRLSPSDAVSNMPPGMQTPYHHYDEQQQQQSGHNQQQPAPLPPHPYAQGPASYHHHPHHPQHHPHAQYTDQYGQPYGPPMGHMPPPPPSSTTTQSGAPNSSSPAANPASSTTSNAPGASNESVSVKDPFADDDSSSSSSTSSATTTTITTNVASSSIRAGQHYTNQGPYYGQMPPTSQQSVGNNYHPPPPPPSDGYDGNVGPQSYPRSNSVAPSPIPPSAPPTSGNSDSSTGNSAHPFYHPPPSPGSRSNGPNQSHPYYGAPPPPDGHTRSPYDNGPPPPPPGHHPSHGPRHEYPHSIGSPQGGPSPIRYGGHGPPNSNTSMPPVGYPGGPPPPQRHHGPYPSGNSSSSAAVSSTSGPTLGPQTYYSQASMPTAGHHHYPHDPSMYGKSTSDHYNSNAAATASSAAARMQSPLAQRLLAGTKDSQTGPLPVTSTAAAAAATAPLPPLPPNQSGQIAPTAAGHYGANNTGKPMPPSVSSTASSTTSNSSTNLSWMSPNSGHRYGQPKRHPDFIKSAEQQQQYSAYGPNTYSGYSNRPQMNSSTNQQHQPPPWARSGDAVHQYRWHESSRYGPTSSIPHDQSNTGAPPPQPPWVGPPNRGNGPYSSMHEYGATNVHTNKMVPYGRPMDQSQSTGPGNYMMSSHSSSHPKYISDGGGRIGAGRVGGLSSSTPSSYHSMSPLYTQQHQQQHQHQPASHQSPIPASLSSSTSHHPPHPHHPHHLSSLSSSSSSSGLMHSSQSQSSSTISGTSLSLVGQPPSSLGGNTSASSSATSSSVPSVHMHQQSMVVHGPQTSSVISSMLKRDIHFPPGTIESTIPTSVKRRKLTSRDIPPVDAWRVYMALKSGLLAESTFALDVLNVYSNDDNTLLYLGLTNMPGLLEVLLEHYKCYLNEMFDSLFDDTEIGYEARQLRYEIKQSSHDDGNSLVRANETKPKLKWYELERDYENVADDADTNRTNETNENVQEDGVQQQSERWNEQTKFMERHFKTTARSSRQMVLLNTTNYTNVTRAGKPVRYQTGQSLFIDDYDKSWDQIKNGFNTGYDHWARGGGETTNHIQSHMEPKNNYLRLVRLVQSESKDKDAKTDSIDTVDIDDDDDDDEEPVMVIVENEEEDEPPIDDKPKPIPIEINKKQSIDNERTERQRQMEEFILDNSDNYPKIRECDRMRYWKRRHEPEYEDESYDQEEPTVVIGRDYQESIKSRALTVSNLIRNLTFVPGNEIEMAKHPGLLLILSRLILLHHNHAIKRKSKSCRFKIKRNSQTGEISLFNQSDDDDDEGKNGNDDGNDSNNDDDDGDGNNNCDRTKTNGNIELGIDEEEIDDENDPMTEKEWWWEALHMLRENTLVTLANISGQMLLAPLPEPISLTILDGILHWAVCPSSYAQDSLPSAHISLSPRRLAYETLSKLSIIDANVDLLLATPPWSRLETMMSNLSRSLGRHEEQTIREFAIVLLSNLSGADPATSRAIALTNGTIGSLITFIEQADQSAMTLINSHGYQMFRENPEQMGTTLDMVRRSAVTLRNLARIPENRPLFAQYEQRLLSLAMSQIIEFGVASVLADVLYETSVVKKSQRSSPTIFLERLHPQYPVQTKPSSSSSLTVNHHHPNHPNHYESNNSVPNVGSVKHEPNDTNHNNENSEQRSQYHDEMKPNIINDEFRSNVTQSSEHRESVNLETLTNHETIKSEPITISNVINQQQLLNYDECNHGKMKPEERTNKLVSLSSSANIESNDPLSVRPLPTLSMQLQGEIERKETNEIEVNKRNGHDQTNNDISLTKGCDPISNGLRGSMNPNDIGNVNTTPSTMSTMANVNEMGNEQFSMKNNLSNDMNSFGALKSKTQLYNTANSNNTNQTELSATIITQSTNLSNQTIKCQMVNNNGTAITGDDHVKDVTQRMETDQSIHNNNNKSKLLVPMDAATTTPTINESKTISVESTINSSTTATPTTTNTTPIEATSA
ncbi:hypothetical protein RDWZM_010400 [Blomia tropicalis]|uniref:ARID domain-containing protein n=1 Tax=Blomia tropicalis TaxID=40697 RepID=A0A9Q0M1L9_BLOTA|nr:hypothetical protein RDWZM_010400 [Blomia tropicalis]